MSGTDPGDDPSLPLSQIERVVATCDRFEAACAPASDRGSRTTWATCPTRMAGAVRELLALELVYRHLSGEVLGEEEFRRRFPGARRGGRLRTIGVGSSFQGHLREMLN